MSGYLIDPAARTKLRSFYRDTLLNDVIPFWLKHGIDREYGGICTVLDRDGSLLDSDKSVWFQGRAAWMFSTLFNTVEPRSEWLEAARSCVEFSRGHCFDSAGKMYFTVTREGSPTADAPVRFQREFRCDRLCGIRDGHG
jgi:N-acylglucosamine 2-epimerase